MRESCRTELNAPDCPLPLFTLFMPEQEVKRKERNLNLTLLLMERGRVELYQILSCFHSFILSLIWILCLPTYSTSTLSSLFFSRRASETPLQLGFMSSTLSFVERLRLFALRVSGLRPSPSRSSFFVPFPSFTPEENPVNKFRLNKNERELCFSFY